MCPEFGHADHGTRNTLTDSLLKSISWQMSIPGPIVQDKGDSASRTPMIGQPTPTAALKEARFRLALRGAC